MTASMAGTESVANEPIKKGDDYGRNDEVTIRKGDETKTLKFKKAEPFLSQGWVIVK